MEFEAYAEQVIKAKAKQLVGRYGFTESDRDDIEQELRLRMLRRLQDYDPDRGSKEAYIACRIEDEVADLVKGPRALKREWSRERSLNLPATDGDGRPADGASLVVDPSVTPEGRDLELDLADLISSFRPEWQKVCSMLPGSTVTGVAEELGVSRKTVSRWVQSIRARFRAAGFGEFL